MNCNTVLSPVAALILTLVAVTTLGACSADREDLPQNPNAALPPPDISRLRTGPLNQGVQIQQARGDSAAGQEVFRFETFGNEGFWTDAVRLPAGIMAAKVTPMQALKLGFQVDSDRVDSATKAKLTQELRDDPTGESSTILNDAAMTPKLIMANAVMGMSAKGQKVGTSCALCHSLSDASVFKVPEGGSIGKRVDGPANHDLQVGKIFATAANTRALYTMAQLQLKANKGKTIGRAKVGLDENSTEQEFDAYFSNPAFYPVGSFDDSFDGNGDTMHNSPLFRQDLAAPYGSEGTFDRLEDFNNFVYTSLFDQTMLTTPGGRAFVHKLAGAAGDEMIANYVKILRETNVVGYPYVSAQSKIDGPAGELKTPISYRVDNAKLLALNAYLIDLPAPAAPTGLDAGAVARGRTLFVGAGCTGCHNANQAVPVPSTLHPMATIFPGDMPEVLAPRTPPLTPVMNTPASFFDDKWAVVNASIRGEKRGVAMPLLLDLARKPIFLHDDSVKSLDALLDPSRGPKDPHPFYLANVGQRSDVVTYLQSLDTGP